MRARKLVPLLAVSSLLASVVVAGTGSDPVVSDGPERGQLGGECLANGSCNSGLSCTLVDGKAKCANAPTSSEAGAVADAGEDSGRTHCDFDVTSSVCPSMVACYASNALSTDAGDAAAPRCIDPPEECASSELTWECNSPHYPGGSCCLTADLLPSQPTCSEAKIQLAGKGTKSLTDPKCPQGQLQFCQGNNQCPPAQHCSPVRILGDYTVKDTVLGVCVD